jgi:serine protease Do
MHLRRQALGQFWASCLGILFLFGSTLASAGEAKPQDNKTQQVKTPAPMSEIMQVAVFEKPAPESIEDLQAIERHVKQLVERVTPCTVAVQVGGAQGSGVIVSKDGYVLTAGHVSGKPGRKVTFTLHDGRRLQGTSLGRNIGIDSGLLKITDSGQWPFVEMGSSKDLKGGQWCLCTGHPGGYQSGRKPVVRLGRVLESRKDVVQTDCTLVGGDSGGPLFDMQGRVIGVHSRIAREVTANFHVPVETYRETWERLAKSEEWGDESRRPVIGIRGDDVKEGCRISEITPGLPAEKEGLKVGDIITLCDGKKVGTLADLIDILGKRKPGDEITLEFLRDGKKETKKLKLVAAAGGR